MFGQEKKLTKKNLNNKNISTEIKSPLAYYTGQSNITIQTKKIEPELFLLSNLSRIKLTWNEAIQNTANFKETKQQH